MRGVSTLKYYKKFFYMKKLWLKWDFIMCKLKGSSVQSGFFQFAPPSTMNSHFLVSLRHNYSLLLAVDIKACFSLQ